MMDTVLVQIEYVRSKHPFCLRGDVVALKHFFTDMLHLPAVVRWFAFTLAWCLREPELIERFKREILSTRLNGTLQEKCLTTYKCIECLISVRVVAKQRYHSPRNIRFMKPEAIQRMGFESIYKHSIAAAIVFGASISSRVERGSEIIIMNRLKRIHGIGACNAPHFLRCGSRT